MWHMTVLRCGVHRSISALTKKKPVEVAGCPPDAFTADGQLWGNPLYNWEYIARDKFRWWVERIKAASDTYDVVRIDHFRGFESYYCIPYGARTPKGQVEKRS